MRRLTFPTSSPRPLMSAPSLADELAAIQATSDEHLFADLDLYAEEVLVVVVRDQSGAGRAIMRQ